MVHHFFTKMGKMPGLGFGTSYEDVLCPKLEKISCKAKIGPSKCFMWYFMYIHFFYKNGKNARLGFWNIIQRWIMYKTWENILQSQNWALEMFYVILHAHFKGVAEYWNLQCLAKISPKIVFPITRGYYIIGVYISNGNMSQKISNKKRAKKCYLSKYLWVGL